MHNDLMLPNELIEKLIVYKILTDKSYMILLIDLNDNRWYDCDMIKNIIKLSVNYYKKYEKLPKIGTIKVLLQKFSERDESINLVEYQSLLMDCMNLNIDLDDKCIEDNIVGFIKARGSFYAISDNITSIEKDRDTSKCITRLEKFNSIVLSDDLGMDYFKEQDEHWERMNNPESKLSFGIDELDRVTNGGMNSDGRGLIVVVAEAGLGKSLLMSQVAVNTARDNKKVIIFTLELSEDVYSKRLDTQISGCNIDNLLNEQKKARSIIDKFNEDHPDSLIMVKEYPPSTISCATIDIHLEKLKNKGIDPDLIVIDYINLLTPKSKSDKGSYYTVGDICREMRALSYKYPAPCLSATQMASTGYGTDDVGMENIAESRQVAHVSDFIVAMTQNPDDREVGLMSFSILKNRLGGCIGNRFKLKIDPFNLRITDVVGKQVDNDIDEIFNTDTDLIDADTNELNFDVEMDINDI